MRWRCFGLDGGKIIAGGHSLVPLMKLRLSEPSVLIDIARIPGLSGIRETGGAIEIGACTTHQGGDLGAAATSGVRCWPRRRLHRRSAGAQSRHARWEPRARRSVGRLSGGDAGARRTVQLQGPNGARAVAAQDFFQGVFTVDLAPDELIVGVRFTPVRTAAYAGCASGPRTSRLSAWPRRSTWRVARSGARASASPAPGRRRRA